MATFNFDEMTDRRHSGSLKWDILKNDDTIPLWVADMDFKACPAVLEALSQRVAHGVFGYELLPNAWYEAIINWQKRRNGYDVCKNEILNVPGIVPALTATLQAITQPGDQVIMQTPAYNCFYSCIRNSGCELLENPLRKTAQGYEFDFVNLEKKLSSDRARVLLLCNPHNPTGRLWSKKELIKLAEIVRKYHVFVISDEIHSDLRPNDSKFNAFATVAPDLQDRLVTMNSPSKAFNLAGLQSAYMIIKNPDLKYCIDRRVNINEICDTNVFGATALIAAYNQGEEWLKALNDYLRENIDAVCDFMRHQLPMAKVYAPEATYLMWLDLSQYASHSSKLNELLIKNGVMLSSGIAYGKDSDGFMRLNVACPRERLMEGLQRIKQALS